METCLFFARCAFGLIGDRASNPTVPGTRFGDGPGNDGTGTDLGEWTDTTVRLLAWLGESSGPPLMAGLSVLGAMFLANTIANL